MDSKGQNFLHLAVLNQDVEAVIFLLSVRVDINSKVQNPSLNTPLHYAVKAGSEILTRHLVSSFYLIHSCTAHVQGNYIYTENRALLYPKCLPFLLYHTSTIFV